MAYKVWPTHRGTFLVREEIKENVTIWSGPVELFGLPDYEKAENCYAWQHTDAGGNVKIIAVLENAFIDSPQKAVQTAIFSHIQPALLKRAGALQLFKKQLQERCKILREAQIKTENLDAALQSVKETMDKINQRFSFSS